MLSIFHVDAFAERPFEGNPAGVCLLEEEKPGGWMQSVAAEMNLSATAFVRRAGNDYDLRWFTPGREIELCGHGTLATAHVLWTEGLVSKADSLRFNTKGGRLTCKQSGEFIELDFPATPPVPAEAPAGLIEALGVRASFVGQTRFDKFVVLDSEEAVRAVKPDFTALGQIQGIRGVIITSRSADSRFDFVSRFFAPIMGLNEDPVTGSAHCALAPYWAGGLGKTSMTGYQASARGGTVQVNINGDRVILGGKALTVLRGELT